MSCGCNNNSGTLNPPRNPCQDCPPNSAENESLPSVVDNFVYHFFGSLTKTTGVDGKVIWALPCDLTTGIEGNPRLEGEGLACYFKRLISDGVLGVSGKNGYASVAVAFVQPEVGSTVAVVVDDTEPFAVGQYVWNTTGGFYLVTAVETPRITLKNLVPPPDNLGAGGTVDPGTRMFPSGPAAVPGEKGDEGTPGTPGHSSYLYIGFASDAAGADFSLSPTTATNKFLNILVSPVEKLSLVLADFDSLSWTRFRGVDGATGATGGEVAKAWSFWRAGTHPWVAPVTGNIRARVYGAGGGGGGGASTANGGGNGYGGGGGEYSQGIVPVIAGHVYTILVAAGGVGGTGGGALANGINGADSKIYDVDGTYLLAKGGHGGSASIAGSPAVGIGGTGGSGTIVPEFPNQPGLAGGSGTASTTIGGHCGRMGAGGLQDGPGETPGGGGGAGMGDGGGAGAPGGAGADGLVTIEVI